MNYRYAVYTQHKNYSPGVFISSVPVDAESPVAAARKRLSWIDEPSDVTALLVTSGSSDRAYVFPTVLPVVPTVSDEPLRVNA